MKVGTKMTGNCTVLPLAANLNHDAGKFLEDMVGTALPRKSGAEMLPSVLKL